MGTNCSLKEGRKDCKEGRKARRMDVGWPAAVGNSGSVEWRLRAMEIKKGTRRFTG